MKCVMKPQVTEVIGGAERAMRFLYDALTPPREPARSVHGVILETRATSADRLATFMMWIRDRTDFSSTTLLIGTNMEVSIKRRRL